MLLKSSNLLLNLQVFYAFLLKSPVLYICKVGRSVMRIWKNGWNKETRKSGECRANPNVLRNFLSMNIVACFSQTYPANIFTCSSSLPKTVEKRCQICSKSKIKTAEWWKWQRQAYFACFSNIVIIDFGQLTPYFSMS